jgi:hypothetical protein
MANKDDRIEESLVKSGLAITPLPKRPNLLDVQLAGLSPAEKKDLQRRVATEQVNLDVKSKEAEHRFINSSRDMARDVQLVQKLEETTRGDYSVDSRYETASGQTNVKIRRNTNMIYMVVAIVIGLIVLLFLNK